MNSSNSSIIIHQTLHGYLNGHSLLACSTVLSPLDERRMLLLSDMSGPSMTKGFESYLTGYPLTEKKIFVLSKTWYAPEMGRPGCVWTHSLLINFVDLGRIFHPQILRKYFSRPESLKMTSEYSQNIEVKPFDWQDLHPSMSSLPAKELRATLYSLYQYPKKQIFVPVQDSARRPNYEEMILSIWEYQGVGLRSKFTFCSGSIENRSSSDIAFDLQIIPERNREKIEQRNKGGVFISDKHREIEKYPYWVNYVVDQLIQYELESNLKAYLNACDGDFRDGRSAYTKLLSIYTFFKKDLDFSYRNIEELVALIAQEFPEKDDAKSLKSFLLGDKNIKLLPVGAIDLEQVILEEKGNERLLDDLEKESLRALCITEHHRAFSPEYLRLETRAKDLIYARSNFDETIQLLSKIIRSEINPLGKIFISGIAENLAPEHIRWIAKKDESVLLAILYLKPHLGLTIDLWDTSNDRQRERLDVILSSPNLRTSDICALIGFCLESQKDLFAPRLFAHFPRLAVETTLDWINENSLHMKSELTKEWKEQLTTRPKEIMEWLSSNKTKVKYTALVFISQLLDSRSNEVTSFGAEIWTQFSKYPMGKMLTDRDLEFFAFLLSIALSLEGFGAGEIISNTFLPVHNAVRDNRLPYESWQRIANMIPELPIFQSWDKCERLRRGLVKRFVQERISPRSFFKATDQADVFEKILQYSMNHSKTYVMLRNEIAGSNSSYLSRTQKDISRKYLSY